MRKRYECENQPRQKAIIILHKIFGKEPGYNTGSFCLCSACLRSSTQIFSYLPFKDFIDINIINIDKFNDWFL